MNKFEISLVFLDSSKETCFIYIKNLTVEYIQDNFESCRCILVNELSDCCLTPSEQFFSHTMAKIGCITMMFFLCWIFTVK